MSKKTDKPDEHLVDILEPPKYMPSGKSQSIVQAIRNGDWLHVTNLWVFRTKPALQILFQQREYSSPMYPGLLDCSAGGYIQAGEDPLAAALRELEEELGVAIAREDVRPFGRHFNASLDHRGRERRRVINKLAVQWEGELSSLRMSPAEVPAAFWVDANQFLGLAPKNTPINIEGLTQEGKFIQLSVTKDNFVYNVDDYHFRIIEHIGYLLEKGDL